MKKIALVTGAGRGIGRATSLKLAAEGYDVAINYHTAKEQAETLCDEIQALGQGAIIYRADVSKEEQVKDMFDAIDHYLGPLNVLINNAGILATQTDLMGITPQRLTSIMAVNVNGTLLCSQQAVRRMAHSRGGAGGTIVNVSSAASKWGAPFEYIDYAASKGAVDTMTIGMARELASENIRVNAVRPAFIDTDMHAAGGEPERINNRLDKIPLQRGGSPEEVAEAIYWLASEKSGFTTGRFIDVDGGI